MLSTYEYNERELSNKILYEWVTVGFNRNLELCVLLQPFSADIKGESLISNERVIFVKSNLLVENFHVKGNSLKQSMHYWDMHFKN